MDKLSETVSMIMKGICPKWEELIDSESSDLLNLIPSASFILILCFHLL